MSDEDGDDEAVRALLQKEAEWAKRRAEAAQPEPEPEPLAAGGAERHARGRGEAHPDVRIVGARAGQQERSDALYKWDDELEKPANVETDALFNLFVVVGLKVGAPAVYYRFDAEELDAKGARAYNGIEHFCYPNSLERPRKNMRPETFTFVLTNPMGGRRIGFCRRSLPSGTGPRYPEVLCIVSRFPWFSLFAKILATLADCPPRQCMQFLREVCNRGIPRPGERISVPMPPLAAPAGAAATAASSEELVHLVRPDDNDSPFSDVNFVPLFGRLSLENILTLFGALLCERRILLLSSKLSRISAASHAAAALLYPFRWQHVFIPILPGTMLHLTTAPMPFLMGIHTSKVPELARMPLEEVMVVDLDANSIQDWSGGPVTSVSGPTVELLPLLQRMAVLPLLKFGTVDPVALHTAVSTTFRGFALALFGRYRLYMNPPEEEGGRATFDHDGFRASLASSSAALAFFDTTFVESQLFDVRQFACVRAGTILFARVTLFARCFLALAARASVPLSIGTVLSWVAVMAIGAGVHRGPQAARRAGLPAQGCLRAGGSGADGEHRDVRRRSGLHWAVVLPRARVRSTISLRVWVRPQGSSIRRRRPTPCLTPTRGRGLPWRCDEVACEASVWYFQTNLVIRFWFIHSEHQTACAAPWQPLRE